MPRKKKFKGRKAAKKRVKTKEAKVAKFIAARTGPRIAPLHGSFLVTALIGLVVTVLFVWQASMSWGITLTIFFIIMMVAALISMTKAPIRE
jgi:preprotein translocase subunit SecF